MDKKILQYSVVLFLFAQILLIFIFLNAVQPKNSILKYFNYINNQKMSIYENNADNKSFHEMNIMMRNPIWEQMNEIIFFKRTSAFYVIERSLLRL